MRVLLDSLKNTKLETFIANCKQSSDTELTLVGTFETKDGLFSLSYLPRKITKVTIEAEYVYDAVAVYQNVGHDFDCKVGEYYEVKTGQCLVSFVSSLPSTVKTLVIKLPFDANKNMGLYRNSYCMQNFIDAICSIPQSVKQLDISAVQFGGNDHASIARVFMSIPKTIKVLSFSWPKGFKYLFKNFESISLSQTNFFQDIDSKKLESLKGGSRRINSLSLRYNQLNRMNESLIPAFGASLVSSLKRLDLGANNLWLTSSHFILSLLRSLPPIEVLGLGANNMSSSVIPIEQMALCFKAIPSSVLELDIGDDQFLSLSDMNYAMLLTALPTTIKRLRMCDTSLSRINVEKLAFKLSLIPPQIDTFILSRSKLFSLSMRDFISVLSSLPTSITSLDLSETELGFKTVNELIDLFAHIPTHIKTIKLNRNHLVRIELSNLKRVMAALPRTVNEVDLSENGFETLYPDEFDTLHQIIPSTIINISLDKGKFIFKNDGILVPYSRNQNLGLFSLNNRLTQRKEFARLRVVLMQWLKLALSHRLDNDIFYIIFGLIFNKASYDEISFMLYTLTKPLISSIPPKEITSEVQQNTINLVVERIKTHSADESILDLSRCGLNRLQNKALIGDVFRDLPFTVKAFNLKHNGYGLTEDTLNSLVKLFSHIPESIERLELSDNGFDRFTGEQLKQLFAYLPPNIKLISLADEKPLSPEEHIVRRTWPMSYQQLTVQEDDDFKRAYIILKDYTKDDSSFWLFMFGHWNRHYAQQISILVKKIEYGAITSFSHLLFELEQIPIQNLGGSLSRRLAFLMSYSNDEIHQEKSIAMKKISLK